MFGLDLNSHLYFFFIFNPSLDFLSRLIDHLNDGVILLLDYDQDPSGFCFLVQIRAFVILTSLGLPNLNMKRKTKIILVVVVK